MPSFTAAKLRWLRYAEPLTHRNIARIVLPKDWLRLWMTGEWATDPSDAAGTQLYDQGAGAWSKTMAQAVDLNPDALPPSSPPTPSPDNFGQRSPATLVCRSCPSLPVARTHPLARSRSAAQGRNTR